MEFVFTDWTEASHCLPPVPTPCHLTHLLPCRLAFLPTHVRSATFLPSFPPNLIFLLHFYNLESILSAQPFIMVLLENLGLQLQVLVDGQTADEYLPPAQQNIGTERLDSQPYICHRYIESFANSHFSISFEAVGANGCLKEWIEADQNNAINFRIKLDGQSVGGRVIDQELRKRICSEFFDLENRTRQYFQFASISPSALLPCS